MRKFAILGLVLAGIAAQAALGAAQAESGRLSDADKAFLVKESRGAAYELDIAKMAAKKAVRPDVKGYAEKLVHDHQQYNDALEKLGQTEGMTLPTTPHEADKARIGYLDSLSGTAFDSLFIKQAVKVNAQDKKEGADEKSSTKSQAIKDFMEKFSDMDAEHEKLAKQLEASNG